jgi:hypothetical protein
MQLFHALICYSFNHTVNKVYCNTNRKSVTNLVSYQLPKDFTSVYLHKAEYQGTKSCFFILKYAQSSIMEILFLVTETMDHGRHTMYLVPYILFCYWSSHTK